MVAASIRPKMEFAMQMWSSYLRKDIDKLEKMIRINSRRCHNQMSFQETEKASSPAAGKAHIRGRGMVTGQSPVTGHPTFFGV